MAPNKPYSQRMQRFQNVNISKKKKEKKKRKQVICVFPVNVYENDPIVKMTFSCGWDLPMWIIRNRVDKVKLIAINTLLGNYQC